MGKMEKVETLLGDLSDLRTSVNTFYTDLESQLDQGYGDDVEVRYQQSHLLELELYEMYQILHKFNEVMFQ